MIIVLARVDERLIHGQIINQWISTVNASHVLIADEELVKDKLMSNIYKMLVPLGLDVQILSPIDVALFLKEYDQEEGRVLLLAKTPQPFERLVRLKVPLEHIMLADKVYYPNKLVLPAESKDSINWLIANGVRVEIQNFPIDEPQPVPPYKL